MREKLIALLKLSPNCICDLCGEKGRLDEVAEIIADNLIANGVTIPVRCKDCVYYREEDLCCVGVSCVGDSHANWYPEDFCSYGERRTDDERTG